MKATFKQFNDFVNLPDEELTEERLAEIFGWSEKEKLEKSKQKIAALQAKKDALKKQQAAGQNSMANKTGQINQAGKKLGVSTGPKPYDKKPNQQLTGAQSRAAERDWAANLGSTNESVEVTVDRQPRKDDEEKIAKLIKAETGIRVEFDGSDLVHSKSTETILGNAFRKGRTISDLIDAVRRFKPDA